MPRGVNFELRRGEIMGIAGLVGAGRSETIRRIFGLDRATGGRLELASRGSAALAPMRPRGALGMGIDFLSEDRKAEGLFPHMTVFENVAFGKLPSCRPSLKVRLQYITEI